MVAVFEQVLILFSFIAIGYVLSKLGIVKPEHGKILSGILVFVISPCNAFSTFSKNFTPSYIKTNYAILLAAVITIASLAIVAYFASKLFTKHKYERTIYEYSFVMANYGYFGYVLAEGLFGEVGKLNLMVFSIPALIFTYTYSFARLTKRDISFKGLINANIIGIIAGMIIGIFGIPVPSVIATVSNNASACMGPVAMLLAGIVISQFNIKRLLVSLPAYVMVALRLLGIPIIVGTILKLLGVSDTVNTSVMLFVSMPCGLNTIVFPRMVDENCEIGASLALLSSVFACVTIPVVLTLFGVA